MQVQRGLSINSIHHIIITIKTFLRWYAKEEDLFDSIPGEKTIRRIEIPRQDVKVIETFTADQFKRLLAACSEARFERQEHHNRAILMVLLDKSMQVSRR